MTTATSSTSALMDSLPMETKGSLVDTVDTTTPILCALGSILYCFQLRAASGARASNQVSEFEWHVRAASWWRT